MGKTSKKIPKRHITLEIVLLIVVAGLGSSAMNTTKSGQGSAYAAGAVTLMVILDVAAIVLFVLLVRDFARLIRERRGK